MLREGNPGLSEYEESESSDSSEDEPDIKREESSEDGIVQAHIPDQIVDGKLPDPKGVL